jgi:predicted ATP-dependent protease
MTHGEALRPEALARNCDPAILGFSDTRDVPGLDEIVGQDRAVEAVAFAIGMRHEGYNLYVAGNEGSGRYTAIRRFLEHEAAHGAVPDDWCYVHNFEDPRRPRALRLPPGRGRDLRTRMVALARELSRTLPAAFESDDYRGRHMALEEGLKQRRDAALTKLESEASARQIALVRTPFGFGVAPIRNGEVVDADAFAALPAEERQRLQANMVEVEADLKTGLTAVASLERSHRDDVRALNRQVVQAAVSHIVEDVRKAFAELPTVVAHIDAVAADLVERAEEFIEAAQAETRPRTWGNDTPAAFHRCEVNLLVDHGGDHGAPVVFEDLPSQPNLIGRIEHVSQMGALLTDFTLVKAGALHRANGGYLVVNVRRLIQQPFAWDELKRALRAGEIRIDGVPQAVTWPTTISIEPEAIPLDVKVVLVGERLIFALLAEADPDFATLFKIQADFNDWVARSPESEQRFGRLLATVARRDGLRVFDADAIAAVIDRAARLAEDATRLSTNIGTLADLLREADRFAAQRGVDVVSRADVAAAVDGRRRRASRISEAMRDAIGRGILRVETEGAEVGQVNGLSVLPMADGTFGWPVRITARIRLGRGDVIDIEREVELGGPIHSKGVLILSGYLGGRFGLTRPLALGASIVFEQSYGPVEGDSASLAELCALLSAIADVPIRQSFALTGSVDQLGRAQAVGGVNEKIEGFFDVCVTRGLTGSQGVLVPASVAGTLMLRPDIVAAVRDGQFAIYAVASVDEAMALLTGLEPGEPDAAGAYPEGSISGRIVRRLDELAERMAEAMAGDIRDIRDRVH